MNLRAPRYRISPDTVRGIIEWMDRQPRRAAEPEQPALRYPQDFPGARVRRSAFLPLEPARRSSTPKVERTPEPRAPRVHKPAPGRDWMAEQAAKLTEAIAWLKRERCVLVSVADREAAIRTYRVSGRRDSLLAAEVIEHAIALGMPACGTSTAPHRTSPKGPTDE